jgi:microcystin-dependent protein
MEGVIGYVTLFAGNFAPRAWAFCQGQLLAIASNTALFSILGTTYGGNGTTTFGLPDFRSRTAIGVGTGPGLSPVSLGEMAGAETGLLQTNQLASHVHPMQVTLTPPASNTANSASPANCVYAQPTNGSFLFHTGDAIITMAASTGTMTTNAVGGNQQPFPIRDPYLGLNYIVCMQGVFPARN